MDVRHVVTRRRQIIWLPDSATIVSLRSRRQCFGKFQQHNDVMTSLRIDLLLRQSTELSTLSYSANMRAFLGGELE